MQCRVQLGRGVEPSDVNESEANTPMATVLLRLSVIDLVATHILWHPALVTVSSPTALLLSGKLDLHPLFPASNQSLVDHLSCTCRSYDSCPHPIWPSTLDTTCHHDLPFPLACSAESTTLASISVLLDIHSVVAKDDDVMAFDVERTSTWTGVKKGNVGGFKSLKVAVHPEPSFILLLRSPVQACTFNIPGLASSIHGQDSSR
ncbi:hypothetical protein BCR39DRAFT_508148 [Naematelia encephala]|uniref:Uncharacterized protein n=1 Tax=Naematelia encephala TaxID=71784 RepID=A0A1Y2AIM4_9TREE|nr:hypothetical protein BCR39DRAFT_508148 [Naematelia encephala]